MALKNSEILAPFIILNGVAFDSQNMEVDEPLNLECKEKEADSIDLLIKTHGVATLKSLHSLFGIGNEEAIQILEDYRKSKPVQSVFYVSGSFQGERRKVGLVKESDYEKILAKFDTVYSHHIYSITSESAVNKKIELISKLDDSSANGSAGSSGVQKEKRQMSIKTFLPNSPKQLLTVKKVNKMKPHLNGKTGDQLSIKNYFNKKEPYKVKSQWIDSLNKDFKKLESVNEDQFKSSDEERLLSKKKKDSK